MDYHGVNPDGSITDASLWEFGRTEMIKDFEASAGKNGRKVAIGSANGDVNVQAIQATSGVLGEIVGAALKVYLGKP